MDSTSVLGEERCAWSGVSVSGGNCNAVVESLKKGCYVLFEVRGLLVDRLFVLNWSRGIGETYAGKKGPAEV